MGTRKLLYVTMAVVTLFSNCYVNVTAQTALLDKVKPFLNIPWAIKAEFLKGIITVPDNAEKLKDYIINHEETFQGLQDFLLTVLSYDVPSNILVKEALPWALDSLPSVLKNKKFLGILKTIIKELNRPGIKPEYVLNSGNVTLDRQYFMSKLLGDLNYLNIAQGILAQGILTQDILTRHSVRDILPYESTDRQLNAQCYNETMDFIDRLLAGDKWALNSKFTPY